MRHDATLPERPTGHLTVACTQKCRTYRSFFAPVCILSGRLGRLVSLASHSWLTKHNWGILVLPHLFMAVVRIRGLYLHRTLQDVLQKVLARAIRGRVVRCLQDGRSYGRACLGWERGDLSRAKSNLVLSPD